MEIDNKTRAKVLHDFADLMIKNLQMAAAYCARDYADQLLQDQLLIDIQQEQKNGHNSRV